MFGEASGEGEGEGAGGGYRTSGANDGFDVNLISGTATSTAFAQCKNAIAITRRPAPPNAEGHSEV